MLPLEIHGSRFLLRPWRRDDRASLLRHINDRAVTRNLRRVPLPYTDADATAWFGIVATDPPPRGVWAIEAPITDGAAPEAVGTIALEPGANIEEWVWEIGYWLARPLWGRGIMTEAVRLVTAEALAIPEVVRIHAPVFSWNPASMRVLEKAGYHREAVLERSGIKDGFLVDRVLFALTRDIGLPYVPFRPEGEPRTSSPG